MEAVEFEYEYFRAGDVCAIDFQRLYSSSVLGWIDAEVKAVTDDSIVLELYLGWHHKPFILFVTLDAFDYLLHWTDSRPERMSPKPEGTFY